MGFIKLWNSSMHRVCWCSQGARRGRLPDSFSRTRHDRNRIPGNSPRVGRERPMQCGLDGASAARLGAAYARCRSESSNQIYRSQISMACFHRSYGSGSRLGTDDDRRCCGGRHRRSPSCACNGHGYEDRRNVRCVGGFQTKKNGILPPRKRVCVYSFYLSLC